MAADANKTESRWGSVYKPWMPFAILFILAANSLLDDEPAQQAVSNSLPQGMVPPAVDLPIQNLPQETGVWCWAAVSQQIIMATHGPQATPPQCALVARAYGQHPDSCCQMPQNCTVTGELTQIQGLIAEFGGRYSSIVPPTDPMTVYRTLAAGKAIIMAVKSSPNAGHVIVIRGMFWQPTPTGTEPFLIVNDPMSYFTQPIPFNALARYWEAAIVVE